jgi:type IV secretory pathway protease TraF
MTKLKAIAVRASALYGRKFWLDTFLVFSVVVLLVEVYENYSPAKLAFNSTASIPRGAYLGRALQPHETPQLGDIACFKYSEPAVFQGRSYFPEGSVLCKPVVAVAGDTLLREDNSLYLLRTGQPRVSLTKVVERDSRGREMPKLFAGEAYTLQTGEYVLIAGAKPNSLDSRFLGVFKREQLFQTVKPLLTFN